MLKYNQRYNCPKSLNREGEGQTTITLKYAREGRDNMKKFKKIVSLLMVVAICFSFSITVNAEETEPTLKYGEREDVTVLKTEYVTVTVTPSGQPPGGTKFSSGGSLYVNTSGGPTTSVDLSVSWGIVGVTVSVGAIGAGPSVDGAILPAPNRTDYFIAKIDKTFKVQYKKIDRYQYNNYIGTSYVSDATLYAQDPYLVKA